jgi:hypothetical protein
MRKHANPLLWLRRVGLLATMLAGVLGGCTHREEDLGMDNSNDAQAGPTDSNAFLSPNNPILHGLNIPKSKLPLIENKGAHRKYPPHTGDISFVKQPQKAAENRHFDPDEMVAAHKHLPIGSVVRATRTDTGKSVIVSIQDRGPHVDGRILDLSSAAAGRMGMKKKGVVPGRVDVLAYPPKRER